MKKSIAVIRALDLRVTQAEHASKFTKLKPVFVSNPNVDVGRILRKTKTKHIKIGLAKPYLIDPISFVGRLSQQSWLVFKQGELEGVLRKVDIYHLQEAFFLYSGQVAEISRKYRKPLVMAPWMCFDHMSTYIPPYSLAVKKSISNTDLFIMRTKRVEKYLSKFRIPDSKKVMIYHGVDTRRFHPRDRKSDGVVRILFVGVLHKCKGVDDILKVYPELVKFSRGKIELVICGRGRLESLVNEMARKYPIRNLGYVSNQHLPEVYRSADIFCGPSKEWYVLGKKRWEEGFGFVFPEAMASGLPVVTYDTGAISEVVGENNFMVKEGDKKALLSSLAELIRDDKLRSDIGRKNRLRVEKIFDLEKQVRKEEETIIKRLL